MVEPIQETWSWRERPILAAALRRLDGGAYLVMLEDLRGEVGRMSRAPWIFGGGPGVMVRR